MREQTLFSCRDFMESSLLTANFVNFVSQDDRHFNMWSTRMQPQDGELLNIPI